MFLFSIIFLISSFRFTVQILLFQSFSPIAWKLGERVITNCAAKIKPYLKEAMQSAGIPLDEYAPIVASIFQDESHTLKCDYSNHTREPLVCYFFMSITAWDLSGVFCMLSCNRKIVISDGKSIQSSLLLLTIISDFIFKNKFWFPFLCRVQNPFNFLMLDEAHLLSYTASGLLKVTHSLLLY